MEQHIINLFTIISSIAAAVAAYLTFRTLSEVQRQREAMYMPDIIIEEQNFYIYGQESSKGYSHLDYSFEKKDDDFKSSKFGFSSFPISIFNIGLATAKDVKIEYAINMEKCVQLLTEINSQIPEDCSIQIEVKKNSVKIIGAENAICSNAFHYLQNQLKINLTHILPINIFNEATQVNLPSFLLDIYSTYVSSFWLNDNKEREFPDFPKFKVNITYKDIGNKEYQKQFAIFLTFNGGTKNETWNIIKIVETIHV